MNSNIIANGPSETITGGTISPAAGRDRFVLLIMAETDIVISSLVYRFPAAPANAGVVNTFTLKAGRYLFNVKSLTFTGTATVIYNS